MKSFIIVLFFICVFQNTGMGQKVSGARPPGGTPMEKVEDKATQFRYTVVADNSDIQKYVNERRDSRYIVVLMEDNAFNLDNLKMLFNLLSRRYDDRNALYARVFTSLDAVPTPEEYDRMSLYGPLENYRKYKNAYFSHDARGDFITYEIPGVIGLKQVYLTQADSHN